VGEGATAGRGKHFDTLGFRTGRALQEGRAIEDQDYYDALLEIQKQVQPHAPGCGGRWRWGFCTVGQVLGAGGRREGSLADGAVGRK
jgi:hypothetical protein